MTEEFNLKEKRKELFEKIEKFYPYLELTIYQKNDILNWIEDQDKEFIKINSEISEEEGKSVIIKDTFQEGFEFAVNRLKRTAGDLK